MQFIQNFITKLSCKKIGSDEFGNEYFEHRNKKRFVVYKGIAEPTKIPAEWHVWIHYMTNQAPVQINTNKYSWQKIHLPNLTGTLNSYNPNNSKSNSNNNSTHYEAWDANNLKTYD
ncbi:MAG: NADH-ubiquinone oxidoreductase subunit NDUFA12 family protein [Alphaproteobacteria bacterium]